MSKKILTIFLSILIIVTFCCGCTDVDENSPQFFPNTKWQSEDKSITIYIADDENGYGSININNQEIDVYFWFFNGHRMLCYRSSDYWKNATTPCLENWGMDCSEGKFEVTIEETTYFWVGEKITFELVEENVDESEIPYPPKIESDESEISFPYGDEKTQGTQGTVLCVI